MLKRLAAEWFGYFDRRELAKYLLLGAIFFLIIGTYWLLSITRDDVFNLFVQWQYQPYAKILSSIFAFPLVIAYSTLADHVRRHRLFYALSGGYIALMLLFFGVLTWYMQNFDTIVRTPRNIFPWIYFVAVESFGSIMVALFWAFAADISTPESAKRGYFLIAICGQMGAILFSSGVGWYVKRIGIDNIVGCALVPIACIPLGVYALRRTLPASAFTGYDTQTQRSSSQSPGFGESIKMVFRKPYLLSVFSIIAIFEIIVTIFEFRLKGFLPNEEFATYLASLSVWINVVALVSLVGGIGNIGRRLGLTPSLMLLPSLVAVCALVLWWYPQLEVAFWVMVASKAFNFALNQPSKEQLYIPTTYEAKYKSKAFIDMFGSRASKGVGSWINSYQGALGDTMFAFLSTWASVILCSVWITVALYLGRTYKRAIENNEYVC